MSPSQGEGRRFESGSPLRLIYMEDTDEQIEIILDKLDPKYFFFELPLYEKILISSPEQIIKVKNLLNFDDEFDAYNFELKENSTFEGYNNRYNPVNNLFADLSRREVNLRCKRTGVYYTYQVIFNNEFIEKFGQFPSLADINIGIIRGYDEVLSQEKLREFVRGIGLRAHGVGIGSFAYLRRIFEYLIEQEHLTALHEEDWDEDSYKTSRMTEKIDLLKNYLPEFLVENRDLYSMLSLGIHELSEEECLKYFDALKMGIQEILDEKVINKQREKRKGSTKKSIDNIRKELAKKSAKK